MVINHCVYQDKAGFVLRLHFFFLNGFNFSYGAELRGGGLEITNVKGKKNQTIILGGKQFYSPHRENKGTRMKQNYTLIKNHADDYYLLMSGMASQWKCNSAVPQRGFLRPRYDAGPYEHHSKAPKTLFPKHKHSHQPLST